jgi:hypothetical protein
MVHRFPKMDMHMFDGSGPTGWVSQMDHYFALHNIKDDLTKIWVGVSCTWIPNVNNGGSGIINVKGDTSLAFTLLNPLVLVLIMTPNFWCT